MPELPEVEVVVRGLRPHLPGRTIIRFSQSDKALRFPLPSTAADMLQGACIERVDRRAKYMLLQLNHGYTIICHLGMTGQFHVLNIQLDALPYEHIRIDFDNAQSLRYRDTRRFGFMQLCSTETLAQHPRLQHLGPEPLSDTFSADTLYQAIHHKRSSIKQHIMDHRVVVGVGNIYASESLFRAKIHPEKPGNTLSISDCGRLVHSIQQVLQEAIEAGGSSISDFVHADGKPGYFAHQFRVYGREGQSCLSCQHQILRCTQSGRSTFYCKHCQQ